MSLYRDVNEFWADRRCLKCDRHLDRRGSLCSDCMEERQEAIEREDRARREEKPLDAWEFLDSQFQQIFGPRK